MPTVRCGEYVLITGLVTAAHLNGRIGRVVGSGGDGRVCVRLAQGVVSFRPQNLRIPHGWCHTCAKAVKYCKSLRPTGGDLQTLACTECFSVFVEALPDHDAYLSALTFHNHSAATVAASEFGPVEYASEPGEGPTMLNPFHNLALNTFARPVLRPRPRSDGEEPPMGPIVTLMAALAASAAGSGGGADDASADADAGQAEAPAEAGPEETAAAAVPAGMPFLPLFGIQMMTESSEPVSRGASGDALAALERSTYQAPTEAERPAAEGGEAACTSCVVCQMDFEDGDNVVRMPCEHRFHAGCLLPWLETHNTCPTCRHELPSVHEDPNSDEARAARGEGAEGGDGGSVETTLRMSFSIPDSMMDIMQIARQVARQAGSAAAAEESTARQARS